MKLSMLINKIHLCVLVLHIKKWALYKVNRCVSECCDTVTVDKMCQECVFQCKNEENLKSNVLKINGRILSLT